MAFLNSFWNVCWFLCLHTISVWSRKHVWDNYCLTHHNEKLVDDSSALSSHGVRNNSKVALLLKKYKVSGDILQKISMFISGILNKVSFSQVVTMHQLITVAVWIWPYLPVFLAPFWWASVSVVFILLGIPCVCLGHCGHFSVTLAISFSILLVII